MNKPKDRIEDVELTPASERNGLILHLWQRGFSAAYIRLRLELMAAAAAAIGSGAGGNILVRANRLEDGEAAAAVDSEHKPEVECARCGRRISAYMPDGGDYFGEHAVRRASLSYHRACWEMPAAPSMLVRVRNGTGAIVHLGDVVCINGKNAQMAVLAKERGVFGVAMQDAAAEDDVLVRLRGMAPAPKIALRTWS